MKFKGKDYLQRRVRLPFWLRLLLILGLGCLGGSAFMAVMDLDRERRGLEQLYSQRGELIIRSMSVALRQKWILESSRQSMSTFAMSDENSDVTFVATTDYRGAIRGASLPPTILRPGDLGVPEPPADFHPGWTPRFKTAVMADGRKAFVVYRPLIFPLESAPDPKAHHNQGKKGREIPPWPPVLDFGDPDRAIYCWVGFDMAPFELAVAAGRRNALIFSVLIGLVLISVLFAVSWSLKFMRNYAVTNEIITRLPVGLILNNPRGEVILANHSAEQIIKIPESRLLGRTLRELTRGAFPEAPEMTAREADVSFLGGPRLRLSITSGQVTGPGGQELGRVVLMADIGEISRLKEELAKQERLARLGGIASGLAHEIRNPLGAIKGLTQHLINKSSSPDDREALQVILNSVERLARTITDFQSYANPAIKSVRVELREFLRRTHKEVGERPDNDAVMELVLPDGPLAVMADPGQLSEALKNLYQNALQAMHQTGGSRPGRLEVTLVREGGSRAVVTFLDSGPGFGQEQLKTPFVPYFSSSAKSSGLGLAKAYNVILAFDGTVTLDNGPDGGALVTVTLPLVYDGLAELKPTEFDVGKFLTEIHSFMSYDSRFKNVALTLDLPDESATVEADRDQLTQVLTNIYLNAIQATETNPSPKSGKLAVRLSGLDSDRILLTFTDNGPGFGQSQLDKPFVPFFTTKSMGMGLGMSIISNIIAAHHGEVRLENTPRGGGRVSIILPRRQNRPEGVGPDQKDPPAGGAPARSQGTA
jgi:two-component system sensor histidine kinase HydH